jgi:predicted  nucleic acid-binding Zn-ribbon protein
MTHTCEDCGETFGTLSRLRLHDCPGPADLDAEQARKVVAETKGTLERGDVMPALPKRPLLPEVVGQLEEDKEVLTVLPLMSGSPEDETTQRIALQTVAGGYVLEHFPDEGWLVVRAVRGVDKTNDEVFEDLIEQVQDWQGTVTDLALDYATGGTDIEDRLRQEVNRGP